MTRSTGLWPASAGVQKAPNILKWNRNFAFSGGTSSLRALIKTGMCSDSPERQPACPVPQATPYDQVPYLSQVYELTNPDRIETVARLYGLQPPSCCSARILEIGCGDGTNVRNLAYLYPGSQIVGFDLAATMIEKGRASLAELGLHNIELHCRNILEIDSSYGEFDFIICHGIYSWIPEEVRRKVLSICATNLSPRGVAYISYNTYPGWHARGLVRAMMITGAMQGQGYTERLRHARYSIELYLSTLQSETTPYAEMVRKELIRARGCPDWYLFHDYLSEINHPFFLSEFVESLSDTGLRYVGDVDVARMNDLAFPQGVRELLVQRGDSRVEIEQSLDYLRNNSFRRSLLVRNTQQPDERVLPERLLPLWIGSSIQAVDHATNHEGRLYAHQSGMQLRVPLGGMLDLALTVLGGAWPRLLCVEDLFHSLVRQRQTAPASPEAQRLQTEFLSFLLNGVYRGFIRVHSNPLACGSDVSGAITASACARSEAVSSDRVSSLRHHCVQVSDFERSLLALLDGTRTLEAVTREVLSIHSGTAAEVESKLKQSLARLVSEGLLHNSPS